MVDSSFWISSLSTVFTVLNIALKFTVFSSLLVLFHGATQKNMHLKNYGITNLYLNLIGSHSQTLVGTIFTGIVPLFTTIYQMYTNSTIWAILRTLAPSLVFLVVVLSRSSLRDLLAQFATFLSLGWKLGSWIYSNPQYVLLSTLGSYVTYRVGKILNTKLLKWVDTYSQSESHLSGLFLRLYNHKETVGYLAILDYCRVLVSTDGLLSYYLQFYFSADSITLPLYYSRSSSYIEPLARFMLKLVFYNIIYSGFYGGLLYWHIMRPFTQFRLYKQYLFWAPLAASVDTFKIMRFLVKIRLSENKGAFFFEDGAIEHCQKCTPDELFQRRKALNIQFIDALLEECKAGRYPKQMNWILQSNINQALFYYTALTNKSLNTKGQISMGAAYGVPMSWVFYMGYHLFVFLHLSCFCIGLLSIMVHSNQKQVKYIKKKTRGFIDVDKYNGVSPCFRGSKGDHCASKGSLRNNNLLCEAFILSTVYWAIWVGIQTTLRIIK